MYLHKNTPSVSLDGVVIQAQLDLGGIAKGYACDLVKSYLTDRGYLYGHFVCGDSSIALLSRPSENGFYTLTLGKPRAGASRIAHYASVQVRNTTLSTSSDSRHGFTQDGIRYCHIIDPRTGWPMNMPTAGSVQCGFSSVSLLTQSAALGDAMTTALCLMSPQEALDFIGKQLPDSHVIAVVYAADNADLDVVTNLEADQFVLEDEAYLLSSARVDHERFYYTGNLFPYLKSEVP